MAAISGYQGVVSILTGAASALDHIAEYNVYRWELDARNDFFRYAVFGGPSGRRAHQGSYRLTGRLSAFYDRDKTISIDGESSAGAVVQPCGDISQNRSSIQLTLTANSGKTWLFNAHIIEYAVRVSKNGGITTLDMSFQSDGTLTTT